MTVQVTGRNPGPEAEPNPEDEDREILDRLLDERAARQARAAQREEPSVATVAMPAPDGVDVELMQLGRQIHADEPQPPQVERVYPQQTRAVSLPEAVLVMVLRPTTFGGAERMRGEVLDAKSERKVEILERVGTAKRVPYGPTLTWCACGRCWISAEAQHMHACEFEGDDDLVSPPAPVAPIAVQIEQEERSRSLGTTVVAEPPKSPPKPASGK
jgi:hypothetical protein